MFQKIWGIEIFYEENGGWYHDFPSQILVSQYQKTLWVNTLEFQKTSGKEKNFE